MIDRSQLLYWAFLCALVGGILVAAGALATAVFMPAWFSPAGGAADPVTPAEAAALRSMAAFAGTWGLLLGALLLVGAWRLRTSSDPLVAWGVAFLVAGALSFPAGGGFLVGALAAIAAGVLAFLAARPAAGGPPTPVRPMI